MAQILNLLQNATVAALIAAIAGTLLGWIPTFLMWRRDKIIQKKEHEAQIERWEEERERSELFIGNGSPSSIFNVDPESGEQLNINFNGVNVSSAGIMLFYLKNTGNIEIRDFSVLYLAKPEEMPDKECILFCQHYPVVGMEETASSERESTNRFRIDVSFLTGC